VGPRLPQEFSLPVRAARFFIAEREKYTPPPQNIPNGNTVIYMFEMVVKSTKFPQHLPTTFTARHSKIYPNWDFCLNIRQPCYQFFAGSCVQGCCAEEGYLKLAPTIFLSNFFLISFFHILTIDLKMVESFRRNSFANF
jgi:hypothetical protein